MDPQLAVLVPALFHLILIFPATNRKSEFVRWHGRQALILAAVRTIVPLGFVTAFGLNYELELLAVPILIVVWFIGSAFGYIQAYNGRCALMRWFGRAEAQPAVVRAREEAQGAAQEAPAEATAEASAQAAAEAAADDLVEVIRYSRDPDERRQALAKLEKLGMVEPL
jgi:uncharacterized membrane protein